MSTPVGRRRENRVLMLDSMSGRETSMEGVSREENGSPIFGAYGILAVLLVVVYVDVVVVASDDGWSW